MSEALWWHVPPGQDKKNKDPSAAPQDDKVIKLERFSTFPTREKVFISGGPHNTVRAAPTVNFQPDYFVALLLAMTGDFGTFFIVPYGMKKRNGDLKVITYARCGHRHNQELDI